MGNLRRAKRSLVDRDVRKKQKRQKGKWGQLAIKAVVTRKRKDS